MCLWAVHAKMTQISLHIIRSLAVHMRHTMIINFHRQLFRSFPKPHLFMTGLKYTHRTASMRLNKIYSLTCRGKARTGLSICIDLSSNLLHKVSVAASLPTELEIQNKDPGKTAKIRLFILLIAYACKEVTKRD